MCWLNGCYHSTDKGLHCTKMKKEILNWIEKYRVLRTYWTPWYFRANTYNTVDKFSRWQTDDFFLIFPRKYCLTFMQNVKSSAENYIQHAKCWYYPYCFVSYSTTSLPYFLIENIVLIVLRIFSLRIRHLTWINIWDDIHGMWNPIFCWVLILVK